MKTNILKRHPLIVSFLWLFIFLGTITFGVYLDNVTNCINDWVWGLLGIEFLGLSIVIYASDHSPSVRV